MVAHYGLLASDIRWIEPAMSCFLGSLLSILFFAFLLKFSFPSLVPSLRPAADNSKASCS
jgi:hypothetical protein